MIIRNSMVIGSITPNDCNDIINTTTISIINSPTAIPTVSAGNFGDRSGIVFPFFSGDNLIPHHPWTGIETYPCSKLDQILNNMINIFFFDFLYS